MTAVPGLRKHLLGVVVLAFGLVAGFAALGAYFDQLSGAASYDVTRWRGSGQGVAPVSAMAGQGIFLAPRFACAACHKIGLDGVGVRGPNLGVIRPQFAEPIAVRAAHEQPGKTAMEHIVQSLYEPDAYIAPGFDAHVMPPVDKPPLMLTHEDIRSVILFMYQRSGIPPTPALTEEILEAQRPYMASSTDGGVASTDAGADPADTRGDAQAGAQRFRSLRCDGCHAAGRQAAPPGQLGRAGSGRALLAAIAEHPAVDGGAVATGALTVGQLDDLVRFLRSTSPPVDAGAPLSDGGTVAVDAGVTPVDGGAR